jgi:hypothetical protein
MIYAVFMSKDGFPKPFADVIPRFLEEDENGRILVITRQSEGDCLKLTQKAGIARRLSVLTLGSCSNAVAEAHLTYGKIQELIVDDNKDGNHVVVVPVGFPAGLFGHLWALLENHSTSPLVPNLYDPTLPDPFNPNIPDWHQNPDMPAGWEDIEFTRDVFDDDEWSQVQRALLFGRSTLIVGKPGTGKTMVAKYIHYHTARTASRNFIECNMASVPADLFTSIFQGVLAGRATGVTEHQGLMHQAHEGTLFLDEIGEIESRLQAHLLKTLTERIEPVLCPRIGEDPRLAAKVSVRYIAATNRVLDDGRAEQSIRADMLSRFPTRIQLKNFYDKGPDPWVFFSKAIQHYSRIALIHQVIRLGEDRVPRWDEDCLRSAYQRRVLPDNPRDLRSFVLSVFENRIIERRPWANTISDREINNALAPYNQRCYARRPEPETGNPSEQGDLASIRGRLDAIEGLLDRTWMAPHSEEEMQDLVFRAKRIALNIAGTYAGDNIAQGSRVYKGATSARGSYISLLNNPFILHPDKSRRKATAL